MKSEIATVLSINNSCNGIWGTA